MRLLILFLAFVTVAPAWAQSGGTDSKWVESVEFPWHSFPRHLWERELAWLKNIGIRHVSLPPGPDAAQLQDKLQEKLQEVIRILRRLNLEADLEGPVPDSMLPLTTAHGGPLTPPLTAIRISALAPDALTRSRKLLASGKPAIIWTDVEETLNASGIHAGAVNFAGTETAATVPLRRNAQLSRYWGDALSGLPSGLKESPVPQPAPGITVQSFATPRGPSFVAVTNTSAKSWTGDLRVKGMTLPGVTVPAHNSAWLPVRVPLLAGPLCKDCTAFASMNQLVYATAELTMMEYENGILAMEFSAPARGEVVLHLSREPRGPLVAGGRPAPIDWDEKTQTVKLPVPAGTAAGNHVRIGLAIEAPDATAFFNSAHVLLIGETNRLTAEFSSEAIAQRSRLRTTPDLPFTQDPTKQPLEFIYNIRVPETAVHGDHAELSLEADGSRMSHARPQFLRPATVRFTDAISLAGLALSPAVVPVNQRGGRDITISIRNNAPEIRTFQLEPQAEGLEFSPAKLELTVGASAARDASFRVFATGATPGIHTGAVKLTGAATTSEAVRFLVVPPTGAVACALDGFSILESPKARAAFIPGRWLEFLNKDNGQNALPAGGVPFAAGPIEPGGDALVIGPKTFRLTDLYQMRRMP